MPEDADHAVPSPVPPDDADAWYAPDIRSQYEVHPGAVITERDGEFAYDVRALPLGAGDETALDRVTDYLADVQLSRPRTREGTRKRVAAGLGEKHRRVLG